MTTDVRRVAERLTVALIIAVLGGGCATAPRDDTRVITTRPRAATATATASPAPSPATATPSSAELGPTGQPATVIRVVDGDTIHAELNGVDEKVRIIGLDSPESVKPDSPVECMAREATSAAKRLLRPGDPILLQPDPTQDVRDRYGRLLAHVYLADGSLFAASMIRDGWAIHYVYDGVPSIHADELAAAEAEARAEDAGLWSPTTCNGNPHEAPSSS